MDKIENDVKLRLPAADGYLNAGRQTGDLHRVIYFACQDFRQPSKVLSELAQEKHAPLIIGFEIFRDKYWKSMDLLVPRP